jgi:uncharacterized phage protein (TIGR01671 family)
MKREIKFRAWDNKHRKMLDWHCITQSVFNNGNTHLMYDVFTNPSFVGDCGFIPMQFTGLHDKNGTEIYEGDVLLVSTDLQQSFDKKFKVEYNAKEMRFEVLQYWESQNRWVSLSNDISYYTYEVIGNIHENPELLG